MKKKDAVDLLDLPDGIIGQRDDRTRGRAWKCCLCRAVTKGDKPIPIPAPCTVCGGIAFELVHV